MKVILLKDVAKIGRRFEVKEVPTGHALNFLIPRGLAQPATQEALRKLGVEMKKKTIMSERHDSGFKSALESLAGVPVTLTLPANEKGHLFKGVHAADIAACLVKHGAEIRESEIVLPHPIKEVGDHEIALRSGETEGVITLHITKA
jgi:large subunit ribosomal protein L9